MAQDQPNRPNPGLQWWAPPKLPRFSGESSDGPAEDFIEEANRIIRAYQMSDAVAVEFIIRHLHGKARCEVLSCEEGEADTPKKVLDIIKHMFGDSRPLTYLMSLFHAKQQHRGQSVLEFSQGLRTLSSQMNGQTPNSISNNMLRDRFVEGLLSAPLKRELRRHVREGEGVTFNTVREEALRWTREEEDPAEDGPMIQQHLLTPQPPSEVQELKKEMASLKEAMKEMQTSFTRLAEQPRAPREPRDNHPPSAQLTVRCFYCNKLGHFARLCMKKKRDEAARKGQQAEN